MTSANDDDNAHAASTSDSEDKPELYALQSEISKNERSY